VPLQNLLRSQPTLHAHGERRRLECRAESSRGLAPLALPGQRGGAQQRRAGVVHIGQQGVQPGRVAEIQLALGGVKPHGWRDGRRRPREFSVQPHPERLPDRRAHVEVAAEGLKQRTAQGAVHLLEERRHEGQVDGFGQHMGASRRAEHA